MVRHYRGWNATDPLVPEAEAVLVFLEALSARGALAELGDVVAQVDEYGVVRAEMPVAEASVFLQAGDGWDRVIWTTPSGRAYEWQWDAARGPEHVSGLIEGRGIERVTYWGGRRLASDLVVDGRTLSSSGGLLRGLLRRMGPAVARREAPAR